MQKLKLQELSVSEFLHQATSFYCEKDFSFALWRLPYTQSLQLAASDAPEEWTDVNLEEAKPGFIFSPFQPEKKKIYLPADEFVRFDSDQLVVAAGTYVETILSQTVNNPAIKTKPRFYSAQSPSASAHLNSATFKNLVSLSKDAIAKGLLEKIVLSRSSEVSIDEGFDLLEVFNRLCKLYPHAMVSIFSSPKTGTWLGATPELLVSVDKDQHFRTVAVAGTQPYESTTDLKTVAWSQKDIEEQALVERYIISCFKKIRLREYDEHGPKTVIAGNLLHLKTEFDVDMVATNFLQLGTVMLKLLHPTSAVCGMPLDASLAFLKTHESYDREFYSGYLGPVNIEQESHLYVNLRCMQLQGDLGILYAGAGILPDSDPEKEWLETELKMTTLLRAIRE